MALLRSRKPKTSQAEREDETIMVARSGSAARQNARNIPLIIGREYRARVVKRSFVIATAVIVVLIVVGAFVPTIIQVLSSNSSAKVIVVNGAGTVAGQDLTQSLDTVLNLSSDQTTTGQAASSTKKKDFDVQSGQPAQLSELRQRVKDGKLDVLLTVTRNPAGDLAFDYYTNGSTSGVQTGRVQSAASQLNFSDKLARAGVPQSQLNSLFAAPQFKATGTSDERNGRTQAETLAAYGLGFVGVVLIYFVISQYGVMVAQGAVEEKSNRVMEIMINAATPFQLLMGKLIGIGLAGLTQLVIVIAAGAVALLAQGPLKSVLLGNASGGTNIDITGLSLGLLGLIGIYFVLGFLLYGALFGAFGSLVSRQEDVQTALGPMYIILLAAYLCGIFGLQSPDANWVVILSYVPFFTPVLMLARASVGTLAVWEIPLTIVIMLVAIVLMTWLAARVYRAGVLMYGQKPGLGKLFKLARTR